MCESRHTRNVSFILHTQRLNSASAAVQVHTAAFPDDPYLETAISAALMRQVARAEIPPAIRLNRTAPILAFGKLDRLRPGYRRAVAIAREAGYLPVERIAGGRAAVFHEGTISFSHAIRAGGGSYAGTRERFAAMAATIAAATVGARRRRPGRRGARRVLPGRVQRQRPRPRSSSPGSASGSSSAVPTSAP